MATPLVLYDPRAADPEAIALAGFLAGYAGRTREGLRPRPAATSPGAALDSWASSTPTVAT